MEKVDIAQQREKCSHSAAAWKKESLWSIVEKADKPQQRLKSSHNQQRGKRRLSGASWKRLS